MCAARRVFIGLLLLACVPGAWAARPAANAPALQGVVTQVTDGDSLRFTPNGQAAIVVRLADIDAPETCQAWGAEARRALTDLALNKLGQLRPVGRDVHGRTLGVLMVDDVNVAQRLVEEGHAWSIRTRNDNGPLVKQERMATALSRGLHAGGGALKPADFRRSHGPCADGAVAAPVPVVPRGAAAPVYAPASPVALPAAPSGAANFRCDGRKHCSQMRSCDEAKYFLTHCPGVKMDGDNDGIPCEDQWCRG